MVRFGEKEIAKEKFYAAKRPIKIWDVICLKISQRKAHSKCLIGIKFD